MRQIKDYIEENTLHNTKEMQDSIVSMICSESDSIALSEKSLLNALELEGEFFVLKLHYDDFEEELKSEKIKYLLSQSLSVIVSYQDDGTSYENIEKFVKYIHSNSDKKQNSTFGVSQVEKLSSFPITILFSGILPINQIQISVGKEIDKLIHSDDAYFVPRFSEHREAISQEIGVPILPVLPILDNDLDSYQVRLLDLTDGRLISEFKVDETLSKDIVESTLLKLFYIYKVLMQDKQKSS